MTIQSVFSPLVRIGAMATKRTVVVEGNIASGKTSCLQYLSQLSDHIEIVAEPVSKWRNFKGHNLLDLMYKDPKRWGFAFQSYVQRTMLDAHKLPTIKPVKMMERSIYSARYCFVENLHRCGFLPDVEYEVIADWYEYILSTIPFRVDQIIYLRTTPPVVHQRLKDRKRNEEMTVPLSYLEALHGLHEDWLMKQKFPVPSEVLVIQADSSAQEVEKQLEKNLPQILNGSEERTDQVDSQKLTSARN